MDAVIKKHLEWLDIKLCSINKATSCLDSTRGYNASMQVYREVRDHLLECSVSKRIQSLGYSVYECVPGTPHSLGCGCRIPRIQITKEGA